MLHFPKIADEGICEEEALTPIPGGTERILFVDDEKPIIDLGRILLKRLGYQVVAKTSPLDALKEFRRHPHDYDLIITDLTMPKMTGDNLAEQLSAVRADIPIILCTGFSGRITEDSAKALGIRGFVLKPIVTRELGEMIRRVLDA